MSCLLGVPVDLAYHLVCWIAAILAPLAGGLAAAAAIIAFTLLVRLLLLPLSYVAVRGSVRGERARARLQPRIAELRRRHRNDPQRLQAELRRAVPGRGLRHVRRLPAAAAPAAGLQRACTGCSSTTRWAARRTRCSRTACSPRRWAVTGWPDAGPLSAQGAVFAALFALLAAVARAGRPGRPPRGARGPARPARPREGISGRSAGGPRRGRPRGQRADLDRPVRVAGARPRSCRWPPACTC